MNFDALEKSLEKKEAALVKGIETKNDETGEKETIKKEEANGKLPKKVLRLALIATCADAKSQLRSQNLNHLINALMKRLL